MRYATWIFGDQEYKLRLTAANTAALEKRLGENPMQCLMGTEQGVLPPTYKVLAILHAAMQPFQRVTMQRVDELYDMWIEAGYSLMDLIPVVMDVLQVSGFLPRETVETVPVLESPSPA
jgi:hypothetical protein